MLKIALVRGKYLNNFEGQNFILNKNNFRLSGISSLFPLGKTFLFPVIKVPSLADLQKNEIISRSIKFLSNRILGDSQILFGLEKQARKFDIFHSADPHYYYSYQLAKLRKKRLINKLILTSWETIPFNNETIYKKKQLKKYSMSEADLFICYTTRAKKCLLKEGVSEKKIKIVKLGVDLSRFKTVKRLKKNYITLLFVGRLVKEKGILDLYEAFKKIQSPNHKFRLKIVGEGPLKSKILKLAKQDGLRSLVDVETRSYEQMPKVYPEADIFIMPSKTTKTWEEQYGMVLIEAMASGIPIIAYNSGVILENLGESGILVKKGDVGALTKTILDLKSNKELRTKLGKMGRERAESFFDSRKTAKQFEEIYMNI